MQQISSNVFEETERLYRNVISRELSTREYYATLACLVDANPYLLSAQLDLYWNAEEQEDTVLQKRILSQIFPRIIEVYGNKSTRKRALAYWSSYDHYALQEMLYTMCRQRLLPFTHRRVAHLFSFFSLCEKTPMDKMVSDTKLQTQQHLKCIHRVPENKLNELRKETLRIPEYWWGIDVKRQQNISHHKHTRAISLRSLPRPQPRYVRQDGVHESIPTPAASILPTVHEFVIECAERLHMGLGRVAVVELPPKKQAYRHTDFDPHLRGRMRYHFVLHADKMDMLVSGTDISFVQPGELWFFDNHVMHRAHNHGATSRIHLILDGFPLSKIGT